MVAYRGGSATLPFSRDRIVKFTDTLQKTWLIPFVPSISDLCEKSDAILVLSVDTSARMRELSEAAHCRKPMFVDKPLGGSLADARQLAAFLDQQHISWFSSSSLRYGHEQRPAGVIGAETWGPGKYIEGFPLDLTYYGIHSIESLYSIMGPGVMQVARTQVERHRRHHCGVGGWKNRHSTADPSGVCVWISYLPRGWPHRDQSGSTERGICTAGGGDCEIRANRKSSGI